MIFLLRVGAWLMIESQRRVSPPINPQHFAWYQEHRHDISSNASAITVIKDQYCYQGRRFSEVEVLRHHDVHVECCSLGPCRWLRSIQEGNRSGRVHTFYEAVEIYLEKRILLVFTLVYSLKGPTFSGEYKTLRRSYHCSAQQCSFQP